MGIKDWYKTDIMIIASARASKVKALKLYWKDRVGATKIPQEVSRSRGEVAERAKAQPALITLPQPQSNSGIILPATALEKELGELRVEVEKYRSYLSKLETLHAEGNVSDDTYQRLKREYAEKLTELERKMEALEKERRGGSYPST
jgi:ABC-type phosphate/phosphonate transport system substrate-binding protein